MREKPLVDKVDVVIGSKGEERLVTVPKATAERWPDLYRPAKTDAGNPTAAARRATDESDDPEETAPKSPSRRPKKDDGPKSPDELPSAPDPTPATAGAATTAGTSGATTEGVTS